MRNGWKDQYRWYVKNSLVHRIHVSMVILPLDNLITEKSKKWCYITTKTVQTRTNLEENIFILNELILRQGGWGGKQMHKLIVVLAFMLLDRTPCFNNRNVDNKEFSTFEKLYGSCCWLNSLNLVPCFISKPIDTPSSNQLQKINSSKVIWRKAEQVKSISKKQTPSLLHSIWEMKRYSDISSGTEMAELCDRRERSWSDFQIALKLWD